MKSKTFTESSLAKAQEAVVQWLAANRVMKVKEHLPVAGKVFGSVSITIDYEEMGGA
jgi:hypothetical protein